jgi:hypothetical protein
MERENVEAGEAAPCATLDFSVLSQNCKTATVSCVMSVCPSVRPSAWENWAPNEMILMKFDGGVFFENLSRKLKFNQNLTRMTDILLQDLLRFMIPPRRIFLRMRNVLHRSYRENQNAGFMFSNLFSRKSCNL